PPPGIRESTPQVYALTGARLIIQPGQVIESGTLVIREGRIVSVGKNVSIPADAIRLDFAGKTIYPGFIDLYTDYGMPSKKGKGRPGPGEGEKSGESKSGALYWNSKVTPQQSAAEMFTPDSGSAEKLRSQGITLTLTVPPGNVITGTAALVNTGEGLPNQTVEIPEAFLNINFNTGGWNSGYPGSLMGVMALIRQSYLDADWYARANAAWEADRTLPRPEKNDALEKLSRFKTERKPVLMFAKNEQAVLREAKLAQELGVPVIMRGSNYEYRRAEAVKATNTTFILPLNFPKQPEVKTPEAALDVSLEQLRHWYQAPENPGRMEKLGIEFSLTSDGLEDKGKFLEQIRTAIERGLSAQTALAALTTTPAKILGKSDRYGTLSVGKSANLVITDGELFDKKTNLLESWVNGVRYQIKPEPKADPRGTWSVTLSERQGTSDTISLELKGEADGPSGDFVKSKKAKLSDVELFQSRLSFNFNGDSLGFPGVVQMSGLLQADTLSGHGVWPDGAKFSWRGLRTAKFTPEPDTSKPEVKEYVKLEPLFPDVAFGAEKIPTPVAAIAYTGATIWTCGPEKIIENGTLLVENGKISKVGENVSIPKGAKIIDAKGKHITPGLIDAHSHSAIEEGVNEGGQTITAEVRIGDVVDATDIGVYRELAGGLTAAQLLHGSANAIGGQSQIIKLRWGKTPEEMKFALAPPTIKFALGENPKQSNWGDEYTTRYPQTRMGVEQIIKDAFQAARDYEKRWKDYNQNKKGFPPRKDLELETILEILNGQRFVHCHSYRQDEILMLMRLAEEYKFRIACFQHILEGYKVADVMAKHGAGGSSFSDWWTYKYEVIDAIPYNGALMHNQGVVVSFNSDSDELARRLNTEAAKAVKYGGVPPEEALKFVTLNPAKQLKIDRWVGSLEPGKDADFVVWSGDPLSTYSICLETWIDGAKYFDRQDDLARQKLIEKERALLIQKALGEKGGGDGEKPWKKKESYSCEDLHIQEAR
ncbi:MAG: amidohydrolase family protein, partial [candidate division Zixibacteria bacterium]|nr:amidohydrolase family protein [candidate division Zixibacteria bacterium]